MNSFIRFSRIVALLAPLLFAAVAVPMKICDHQGMDRVKRLKRELSSLKGANDQIRRENEALANRIRAFHSDPAYIEKIARDEFGMVAPGEIIYQFPNAPDKDADPPFHD